MVGGGQGMGGGGVGDILTASCGSGGLPWLSVILNFQRASF